MKPKTQKVLKNRKLAEQDRRGPKGEERRRGEEEEAFPAEVVMLVR